MKPIPFSKSAIERIRGMESSEILEFLGEIESRSIGNVLEILPLPKGFRPNSPGGKKKRIELLAKRLSTELLEKKKDVVRDFDTLSVAWQMWGYQHLGDTETLHDYVINRFEENEDNKKKLNKAAQNRLDANFIKKLSGFSKENKCTRRQIKKFVNFSPLDIDKNIKKIVSSSKSAEDVKQARHLEEMPEKIARIESDASQHSLLVKTLETKLADALGELASLNKTTNGIVLKEAEVSSRLEELTKHYTETSHALGDMSNRIEKAEKTFKENFKQSSKYFGLVDDLSQRLDDFISGSSGGFQNLEESIEEITVKLGTIEDELKNIKMAPSPTRSPGISDQLVSWGASNFESYLKFPEPAHSSVESITSAPEVQTALVAGLLSAGLKKSSAEIISLEIIAGLCSGQVIFFSGALGGQAARACAHALAAGSTIEVQIPVGVRSPGILDQALQLLEGNGGNDPGCLLINGINRSAFDTFGDLLIQMIVGQRLLRGPNAKPLIILSTIVDGPGSLPPSIYYSALGPTFYVDCLDWQIRPVKAHKSNPGRVSIKAWEEITNYQKTGSVDSEEINRLLEICKCSNDPLLRSTFIGASKALSVLKDEGSTPTVSQSFYFGWFGPLCAVTQPDLQEFRREIDGGKVDNEFLDPRLNKLLDKLAEG